MILFISETDRERIHFFKAGFVYLVITIFCALFGAIYEHFSHEVYSYYMIYAFAYPLIMGALPFMIIYKSKQISKLVSRLLLLARIDQNRQKFNKEKVDLGVIIDVATDSMKELALKKKISLLSNVPEGTIIDADESLLLSAITNLISNGIKYGKESGQVIISVSKLGDKTKIVVSDNGVGISEEHIDKIWTRFYRVDDVRNDEYLSSGLGLSMVKSIIELHGGEISVKSSLGHGTEFKIIL